MAIVHRAQRLPNPDGTLPRAAHGAPIAHENASCRCRIRCSTGAATPSTEPTRQRCWVARRATAVFTSPQQCPDLLPHGPEARRSTHHRGPLISSRSEPCPTDVSICLRNGPEQAGRQFGVVFIGKARPVPDPDLLVISTPHTHTNDHDRELECQPPWAAGSSPAVGHQSSAGVLDEHTSSGNAGYWHSSRSRAALVRARMRRRASFISAVNRPAR